MKSGSQNSLSLYRELLIACFSDVACSYGTNTSEWRCDYETIRSRVASEGMDFLTKVLPSIAKAVDSALSTGKPLAIPFLKKRSGTQIPKLFGCLLEQLFNSDGTYRRETERATVERQVWVLRRLRQVCYLVYKLELTSDPETIDKAVEGFIDTDRDLADLPNKEIDQELATILDKTRQLACRILGSLDYRDIRPKHGPGAVATGEKANEKKFFKRYYERIARVYPYEEYFYYSLTHLCDRLDDFIKLEELQEGTSKMCLVPKDSRGPRIIATEPLEYQWIQQGLMELIVDQLERHWLTRGHLNFRDQTVNQRLALIGSKNEQFSTLDLKDASDRVSVWLVEQVFKSLKPLLSALMAARTPQVRLPDGAVYGMHKFATMGSALCFPIEAFVFFTLAASTLHVRFGMPFQKACRYLHIYGDDIIVEGPPERWTAIMEVFHKVGLKFNPAKCCTTGPFRESCGVDAFQGFDVTPTKLRRLWNRRDPAALASWCAYQRAFEDAGYYELSDKIIDLLGKEGIGNLAIADLFGDFSNLDSILHWRSLRHTGPTNNYNDYRVRKNHGTLQVYAPTLVSRRVLDRHTSWEEMLRCLNIANPFRPVAGYYSFRHRVSLKWRWTTILRK